MKQENKDKNSSPSSIRKNDQVLVITGKENGKKGRVLKMFPETGKALVEGLNFIKKAQRPSQKNQKGGFVQKEAPIDVSNLMLICRHCSNPTRVGRRRLENSKRVRICKKCGEIVEK